MNSLLNTLNEDDFGLCLTHECLLHFDVRAMIRLRRVLTPWLSEGQVTQNHVVSRGGYLLEIEYDC